MKQPIKIVEVKSVRRYPYNGKYHFNISLVDMSYYVVEHVRRDGLLAVWQPKVLRARFSTVDEAENAVIKWAKRPLAWTWYRNGVA